MNDVADDDEDQDNHDAVDIRMEHNQEEGGQWGTGRREGGIRASRESIYIPFKSPVFSHEDLLSSHSYFVFLFDV